MRDNRAKSRIPNLPKSPGIGQNSDGGTSDSLISGQSLINVNCYNSRISYDIDMKLRSATKLDKKDTVTSNKLTMISCRQFVASLSFFRLIANLEQSGSRIPGAWSVILTSHIKLSQRYYFCQKMLIFCKNNADISKIKKVLVLKGIFSEIKYVRVLTYQISSFYFNPNDF